MLGRLVAALLRKPVRTNYLPLSCSRWIATLDLGARRRSRKVVYCAYGLLFTVLCVLLAVAHVHRHPEILRTELVQMVIGLKPLPPLYREFRKQEQLLPQHASKTPFAHGQKYLWVASHSSCTRLL